MTTPHPTDGPELGQIPPEATASRRCAYCGDDFSYQRTASRPPTYCSRIWPEPPRTCQARAKAQRNANKTVGLELPLATYQQASEPVLRAVETLHAALAGHRERLTEVESTALRRIEEVEREARQAWERAQAAEAEQRRAEESSAAAEYARDEAVAAADLARQRAKAAEADRDQQLREAWQQVAAKEGERAAAVAKTAEADARARAAQAREAQQEAIAREAREHQRADAERAEQLAAANRDLATRLTAVQEEATRQAAAARTDLKAAHAELAALHRKLTEAHARHADELTQLRQHATVTEAGLRNELDAQRTAAAQLRAELNAERGRVTRLTEELKAVRVEAEQRHEQLVAALRARPATEP